MKITIERDFVAALSASFPRLIMLEEQLKLSDQAEIDFKALNPEEAEHLFRLYEEAGPAFAHCSAQIVTLRQAFEAGGKRYRPDELEQVVPDLAAYMMEDAHYGWLFAAALPDKPLPYVPVRIDYVPPSSEESGKIYLDLKANVKGQIATVALRFSAGDIEGKTIGEILASKGYVRETPALVAAYEEATQRYFDWRPDNGRQFSARGVGFYAEDPSATHRDTDWSRKDLVVLSSGGNPARLVNDEAALSTRNLTLDAPGDILGPYLRRAAKSNDFDAEKQAKAVQKAIPPGLFGKMPIHGFMFMYHLELHHYLWVHVNDMVPYAYDPALKDKLVLPEEQTDLIDILTAEMDLLMDDIVAGKSGGTTVLCAGPPGVGKTLTAEVYSEIIGRPLYRIHSGQLGLNVAQMETALKAALTRAQRWGAVMLIDEADVYIRRRDDDIAANAVVGVFLRVLEYFNGLLFLTTNRVDDIDEAIVSRCIALIKFQPPDEEARRDIWRVMAAQFGLVLDEALICDLSRLFACASGRDIKGLAKLVAKYCHHKHLPPTLAVFRRCAIFRGLEEAESLT